MNAVVAPWKTFFNQGPLFQSLGLKYLGVLHPSEGGVDGSGLNSGSNYSESYKLFKPMTALVYYDVRRRLHAVFGITDKGILIPMQRYESLYRDFPRQDEIMFEPVTDVMFFLRMPFFTLPTGDLVPPIVPTVDVAPPPPVLPTI